MATRGMRLFENLTVAMLEDHHVDGYHIPRVWLQWENAYLTRPYAIIRNPQTRARLIADGCQLPNGTFNCREACRDPSTMFETPQTLWNCMTLATLSVLTRSHHIDPGNDTINETQMASANEVLNFGNLNTFDFPFALYRPCVLESCSDPRFGGCSPNVTEFLSHPVSNSRIRSFANVMSTDYCGFSDQGIDYDIAGPGIMIAYFFQFGLAFFFFFALKMTTSWVKSWAYAALLISRDSEKHSTEQSHASQQRLSSSSFAKAIRRAIVDLQETQAAFLVTIAVAAIATFRGKEGTGLANIPTVVSWITNDTILRGIVAAGSYPLLLVQLALHAAGKRWWYTLLFIVANLILVLIMDLPKDIDPSTLLPHFQGAAENLGSCGSHAGPMTFCQRFRQSNTVRNPITQPHHFFFINSRHPEFIYVISGCLVLDWTADTIINRWDDQLRSRILPKKMAPIVTPVHKVFWALLEVATLAMCVLSLVEIRVFWDVLKAIGEGSKSETNINNWGFGQLIAVAVWFPVILKLCCYLIYNEEDRNINTKKSRVTSYRRIQSPAALQASVDMPAVELGYVAGKK